MNKVSRVKNDNFTIISNVFLKDKNLSIKAKGFLAVVMGLPSDWEFSIDGVCSILKEGKTTIYNVVDELREHGYCVVKKSRDAMGRISGSDYTFFEEPHQCNPYTENPNMDNPNVENQPQLNTYSIKDLFDKEKTNTSTTEKNIAADEFIERMYKLYPTKCPKRGASLGKSRKDKDRIKKLLKTYSMEDVEMVFNAEIEEKFEKQYMQNFSTFLNNFPDPNAIKEKVVKVDIAHGQDYSSEHIIIDGQIYR
jgi:hypothetical protein